MNGVGGVVEEGNEEGRENEKGKYNIFAFFVCLGTYKIVTVLLLEDIWAISSMS